jgi:predicted permease
MRLPDLLARDVPYAARTLRRTATVSLLAVVTLALGIGANAAIFSVVNAVLLRPLPYREPDRLVRVFETKKDDPTWTGSVAVPNLNDWREQSRTIEGFVAYEFSGRNLQRGADVQRVSAVTVSANAFAILGHPPLLGRGFAPGEDAEGRNQVVVLSEGLWRREFGADPAVVGRAISLDGVPHEVVGVMPADFGFPAGAGSPELWVPYTPRRADLASRDNHFLSVIARLRPGVTLGQASAEMRRIAERLEGAYPRDMANRTVGLVPLPENAVGRARPALLVLFGAVTLVLLVACANVAALLLARAAARRQAAAVRLALGATRGRLVREQLVESTLLALVGAVLGTAVAWGALRALARVGGRVLPVVGAASLDPRVLAFLLGVSVLCGLAAGLAPALQASSWGLRDALAGAGGKTTAGGAQQRARTALVVAQMALSLVLLAGAGLLLRAFALLNATSTGLEPAGVVTARLSVPRGQYGSSSLPERVRALYFPALERVRALPGVRAAAVINMLPIESWGTNGGYWIDGRPKPPFGQGPSVELRQVSPGYFAAMGIPLKAGRDFTEADGLAGPEPTLVNEAFARREFPGESPIGRRIRRGPDSASVFTIVGVVGDVRQAGLDREPMPEMYFTYRSDRAGFRPSIMVVRAAGGAAALTPGLVSAVRAAVTNVAPDVPLYAVRTMGEVIGESLAARRFNLLLLGAFAAVAVTLAACGLYGVLAYAVTQRSRELGIRVALGADRRAVIRLVVRHGAAIAGVGIAAGLAGAALLSRVMASMLYGVGARDPLTLAGVSALLGAVALAATYVPARRAARSDPMVALRAE